MSPRPSSRSRAGGRRSRLAPRGVSFQSKDSRGGGNRPGIPAGVLEGMERAFGEDFSGVRVVKDSEEARRYAAYAFTDGDSVHFAPGWYRPETSEGLALLGHELAHVRQQRRGRVQATARLGDGVGLNASPRLEGEAERSGRAAAARLGRGGFGSRVGSGGGGGEGGRATRGARPGTASSAPGARAGGVALQRSADAADQDRQAVRDRNEVQALEQQAWLSIQIAALLAALAGPPGGGPPGPGPGGAGDGNGGGGGLNRKRGRYEGRPDNPRDLEKRHRPQPRAVDADEPMRVARVVQAKSVATGYGGFAGVAMNRLAAAPGAAVAPAAPNVVHPAVRLVSNTSKGVQTTDLHRQKKGTAVGKTRPNHWAKFVSITKAGKTFVQGHSLSQKLGGKGKHNNLSPFTRSLNGLHSARVEQEIIDHTRKGGADAWADYDVSVHYLGNPGIKAWGIGKFNGMTLADKVKRMKVIGVITAAQGAAYLAAGAIPAAKLTAARNWIKNYVNNSFPTYIKCEATFIKKVAGAYKQSAAQKLKLTNDI